MLTERSQRWRDRRSRYVDGDTVIDPRRYAVDLVAHDTARAFVADHHYLARYPAAQLAVGLFGPGRSGTASLDGIIVFGVPATGAVVSFSDPQFGHCGCVYAALSGAYRGTTRPRTVLRIAGETMSGRALSKIRNLESGHAGAIDRLVRLGAPRPGPHEHPRAWLDRCRSEGILTPMRQAPLFTYCFALTRDARRQGQALPRLDYPRRSDMLRAMVGPGDH